MIRGLTRAGVGDVGDDQSFIKNAAAFGFKAVDIDPSTLVDEIGLEETKALLKEHDVQIGSTSLPVDWQSDDQAFRQGLPELIRSAAIAEQLGVMKCTTYILPSRDEPTASYLMKATRRIRICADILYEYNLRLGLECVGCHHLRTEWKYPFIWRMEDTLAWIDQISANNVGLLLDSYHWHTNNLRVDDILQLRPEQIIHVHINDAPDLPIEEVLDDDRLYPGEGVIDLAGF